MANHARIAAVAAWIGCMSPLPAFAGPHDAAIEQIIDEAVADWTVILSCSVLDAPTHEQVLDWWNDERADLDEVLVAADVDAKLAASIRERTDPDALMAPTRGELATLIALCIEDDWRRRLAIFGVVLPVDAIEDLID